MEYGRSMVASVLLLGETRMVSRDRGWRGLGGREKGEGERREKRGREERGEGGGANYCVMRNACPESQ